MTTRKMPVNPAKYARPSSAPLRKDPSPTTWGSSTASPVRRW
ncbi:Uncharacterised protein [Mycobacteroides abscessus]|nr:Uncharacterised protein [Mycobacteroides abscessus]